MTLGCVRSRGLWVSLTVGMVGGVFVPWVCAESPVTAKVPMASGARQGLQAGSSADVLPSASNIAAGDLGSCCLESGYCCDSNTLSDPDGCTPAELTETGCNAANGSYQGDGTSCSTDCCPQTPTNANVCSATVVKELDVSGACVPDGQGGAICPSDSATYTGDNRGVDNGTCSSTGGTCRTNEMPGGGEPNACPVQNDTCDPDEDWCALLGAPNSPVDFISFAVNQDSTVKISYCGTGFCPGQDPGPGPDGGAFLVHPFILPGFLCQAGGPGTCGIPGLIMFDLEASIVESCDDSNPVLVFPNVPGPHGVTADDTFEVYHYPVFAGKRCSLTPFPCRVPEDCSPGETCDNHALNYQIKIEATAFPPQACCLVVGGVPECQLLPPTTCEAHGGYSADLQECSPSNMCDTGSCCYAPADPARGSCDDGGGGGIAIGQCGVNGTYFGGALCDDQPCLACEIDDPEFCQTANGNFIHMTDSEVPGAWADDFRPQVSGIADEWCWQVCFYNPTDEVECFYDPPPDDFYMTIYADAGGLPGIELMPYSPIDVVAKAPEDLQTNRCWQYSFHVPDAPLLTAQECYWVSLEGSGDPGGQGCTVYTQTSEDGNGYVLHDIGGGWEVVTSIGISADTAVDLAFCTSLGVDSANGGCGDFSGTCCFSGEVCTDVVGALDCNMAGGLFLPGEECAANPCPPDCANDDCPDAIDLNNPVDVGDCDAGLPCSSPVGNQLCDDSVIGTACVVQPGADPSPGNAFGSDAWYKYTAGEGECGDLTVSMCCDNCVGFGYDAMLALYVVDAGAGCPVDITIPDDCGDDTCGIGSGPAMATATIFEGQDMYIRVGGWEGAQGFSILELTLEPSPCPDPDQAARPAPNVEHLLWPGITCLSQADCLEVGSESVCIPDADHPFTGVCYVPGNVWLSTKPNPNNAGVATARRISLLTGDDPTNPNDRFILGWIGVPEIPGEVPGEVNPQYLAHVQDTPEYVDWSAATGTRPTHVGGCEVSPAHSYVIQAIRLGLDTEVEAYYSPPLTLHTVDCYGDVVGSGVGGNFPNGSVSLLDVFALVHVFQGDSQIPRWRADLEGNFLVSLSDVFRGVGSFQSGCIYPYAQPCNCQGQNCP